MLIVIYIILGYWAAGRTIYANKILIGSLQAIVTRKAILGLVLGWILIPWAVIKLFTSSS